MADISDQIITAIGKFSLAIHSSYVGNLTEIRYHDSARPTDVPRLLYPTGTFAAAVWQPGDDIRLVSVGKERKELFWGAVSEALDMDAFATPEDATLELPLQKLEPDVRTLLGGGKIFLHWCPIPKRLPFRITLPWNDNVPYCTTLDERRHLVMVEDAHIMTYNIRDGSLNVVRETYLRLRAWAQDNGLLGHQFGLLSVDCLLWKVKHQYTTTAEKYAEMPNANLSKIVEAILRKPNSFGKDGVAYDVQTSSGVHLATDLTIDGVFAIKEAQDSSAQTRHHLISGQLATEPSGYDVFLKRYPIYLTVSLECWSTSKPSRRQIIETELPTAIKLLAEKIRDSNMHTLRIWPTPISEGGGGNYVLGVAARFGEEKVVQSEVLASAVAAEPHLFYNRAEAIITLAAYTRAEFPQAYPAPGPQRVYTSAAAPLAGPGHRLETSETSRFRPASSALARLRHDPRHASTDYEVGYQDRFDEDGVLKWISLEDWGGKETEDEDFIPMHRIRQVKRTSDGRVVWCRDRRIDLLHQ